MMKNSLIEYWGDRMNIGDDYYKHVRGSRYGFNNGKLFYKYPQTHEKLFVEGDRPDLFNDLCDAKDHISGRFRINEEREITVYRKEGADTWIPKYAGKATKDLGFEGIENNPKNLKPGLLWTGFASHHGSKYHITNRGKVYFKETYFDENGISTTKKYPVTDCPDDFKDRLLLFKQSAGSFRINEYDHVWAPVEQRVLKACAEETEFISLDEIQEQFMSMTRPQNNTIRKYSKGRYNPRTRQNECWMPVYIGKYSRKLTTKREHRQHIVIGHDEDY